jgi:uncharacterized SAM-binding protein YcdF (DUF218 family)
MLLISIHRILQSFALPPLNVILIFIVGLLLVGWRRRSGLYLSWIALFLLYLQSTPFFVYGLANILEESSINAQKLQESQAIVVIGGGTRTNTPEYGGRLAPNSWTLTRLEYTAYLAKQYPNKIIVVSGGLENKNYNSEADIMARVLRNEFNVKNPIIIENKSRNTDENAKFVAQILQKMQIYNIALVTQAFHSMRATALFDKYGLHATAAPTGYIGMHLMSYKNIKLASFVPNAETMHYCAQILHEIYGYVIYIGV